MSLPLRRIALFATPVLSLFLASCGDEAECQGADLNGVCFMVSSVVPTYLEDDTSNVDIYPSFCASGNPEPYTDHGARLTLSAFTIGNNRTTSTRILLTRFVISYQLNSGSNNPRLGPDLPSTQAENFGTGQTFEVPVNGTLEAEVSLFDIQQKGYYHDAYVSGGYPVTDLDPASTNDLLLPNNLPSYTATYTVYGQDEYGREVSSTGSAEIKIGAYNACSS